MAQILVIDDEHACRATIRKILENDGHEVETAASGHDGLFQKDRPAPDLIITDLLMPDLSGLEVIHELRKRSADLKIIAISGARNEAGRCLESLCVVVGADEFMKKPFLIDHLTGVVNRCLSHTEPKLEAI